MDWTYLFLVFVVIGIPVIFFVACMGNYVWQGRNVERKVRMSSRDNLWLYLGTAVAAVALITVYLVVNPSVIIGIIMALFCGLLAWGGVGLSLAAKHRRRIAELEALLEDSKADSRRAYELAEDLRQRLTKAGHDLEEVQRQRGDDRVAFAAIASTTTVMAVRARNASSPFSDRNLTTLRRDLLGLALVCLKRGVRPESITAHASGEDLKDFVEQALGEGQIDLRVEGQAALVKYACSRSNQR